MDKQTRFKLFSNMPFAAVLVLTLLFNALIATVVTASIEGSDFFANLILSQIIGLSILCSLQVIYELRYRYTQKTNMNFMLTITSLMVGAIIGVTIVWYFSARSAGVNILDAVAIDYRNIIQNLFLGLIFGSIIVNFFMSREKLAKAKAELQQHKITLLDNEKRMLESELKLLQSQIEPHFLFNTLSNIIGLIEKNPLRGKTMLESLTHYLRATLEYSRVDSATLEDELRMVKVYLDIFKERMGKRLQYTIDVDKELYRKPFPPMLLQPIVENSIKHGLESLVDGGCINILGDRTANKARFIVEDSGIGLNQEVGSGVGLSNVQQRLKALYGDMATLILEENQPSGLRVVIEFPNE